MYKEFDPYTDYSGNQFCHIRLDHPVHVAKDGKKLMYSCTCMKCGKTGLVYWGKDVHDYRQRSCGCTDFRDLSNGVFGKWTAIDSTTVASVGCSTARRVWRCKCSCDLHTEKLIKVDSLVSGRSTSCGCVKSPSIIGQHFGNLTVLSECVDRDNGGGRQFRCLCKCGKEIIVSRTNLLTKHTTSCGSCSRTLDLTGRKFGLLTALYMLPDDKLSGSCRMWHCKCACGNEVDVASHSLVCRHTTSCGCNMHRKKYTTEEERRLVTVRQGMIYRCYNTNCPAYDAYGGRGIKVCDEWLDPTLGKKTFIDWALSNGYKLGLSIDRIDVNGDYCPENCRWTDWYTQCNNKRCSRRITIDGVTKTATQWVDEINGPYALKQTLFHLSRDLGNSVAAYVFRKFRNNDEDQKYFMSHPI